MDSVTSQPSSSHITDISWHQAIGIIYTHIITIYSHTTPLRTRVLWSVFIAVFVWLGYVIHRSMARVVMRYLDGAVGYFRPPRVNDADLKILDQSLLEIGKSFKETPKRIEVLPKTGWKYEVIMKRLEKLSRCEMDKKQEGKFTGKNYDLSSDITSIAKEGAHTLLFSNLLHYGLHPGAIQMQNEVQTMCINMLNGRSRCTGVSTFGQLESSGLTLLAYKRYFMNEGIITDPEVVLPDTIHPSWLKACELVKVRAIILKTDPLTGEYKASSLIRLVTSKTIVVVCSAPDSYFGAMDPVEDISRLAQAGGVNLHVDASMGSFLLPFVEQAGFPALKTAFDFSVPGVSSMTAEPSTYGGSPAGMSVIMFAHEKYQKALYWSTSTWCGYVYASNTFMGSKGGFIIGAAWAALMKIGEKGFIENTKLVVEATQTFIDRLTGTGKFSVPGSPRLGLVAFRPVDSAIGICQLGSAIEAAGWSLEPVFRTGCLQLTVHKNNALKLKELVQLLKKASEDLKAGKVQTLAGRWLALDLMERSWKKNRSLGEEVAREFTHKLYCQ